MFKALRKGGLVVNAKRVARLMRLHGMAGRHRRRTCRTTFPGPDGYQIPDLVGRRFASLWWAPRNIRGLRRSASALTTNVRALHAAVCLG
jgi:helix-turn-helix protein